MEIKPGRTFRIGDSVAVCLPNDMGFGSDVDVEFVRDGEVVTIRPRVSRPRVRMTPREFVEVLDRLPKPNKALGREPIEFPERPGL